MDSDLIRTQMNVITSEQRGRVSLCVRRETGKE